LIAYDAGYEQGLRISGAALESITHVLVISTVIAFMTVVAGAVLRRRRKNSHSGFLDRKPFALPAIAFIITVLLVMNFFPIPMSEYYGRNEIQENINGIETIDFTVYDSIFYSDTLDVTVAEILDFNESLHVELEGYANDTLTINSSFIINGTGAGPIITHHEFNIPLQPGSYELVMKVSWYEHGVEIGGPTSVTVIFSQPMAPGMFNEVLQWQTYRFLLLVLSIFLLIGGLCITTEKKTRAKEGYERRWDLLPYG
jgi:amino acid transporter